MYTKFEADQRAAQLRAEGLDVRVLPAGGNMFSVMSGPKADATPAQADIKTGRAKGYAKGKAYIAEHGIAAARKYAKKITDESPKPGNHEYGWLDGFMNAITEHKSDADCVDGQGGAIEAYGVKGMKSTPWRKTFKSQAAFEAWLDKNSGDYKVEGTREVKSDAAPLQKFEIRVVYEKSMPAEPGNLNPRKKVAEHHVVEAESLGEAMKKAKLIVERKGGMVISSSRARS